MDTLKMMRLVLAVAEKGSLSAVARSWGVAPSTVTLGLQRLEAQLGTQLVLRSTRQMSLTPEGERFLDRARRILADLDEVMAGSEGEGPLTGALRVTATNDLGRLRIVPLLDSFMRAHPGVTLELLLSDRLVDLVEGGFDLALRTGPLRDSELTARLLLRGRKQVCAAPAYWDRMGRPAHPQDLARHNCLVLSPPGERQANWTFREGEKRLKVRVGGDRQVNDGQTLRDWAVAGAGVVLKSGFDVAHDIAAGRLEPVLEGFTTEATNLYAVSPRLHGSRRVQALVEHLSRGLAETAEGQDDGRSGG